MNAPKILPWMARRAGIDDQHALTLWVRAVADAERMHGCKDGAHFHAEAMARFIEAISANA